MVRNDRPLRLDGDPAVACANGGNEDPLEIAELRVAPPQLAVHKLRRVRPTWASCSLVGPGDQSGGPEGLSVPAGAYGDPNAFLYNALVAGEHSGPWLSKVEQSRRALLLLETRVSHRLGMQSYPSHPSLLFFRAP